MLHSWRTVHIVNRYPHGRTDQTPVARGKTWPGTGARPRICLYILCVHYVCALVRLFAMRFAPRAVYTDRFSSRRPPSRYGAIDRACYTVVSKYSLRHKVRDRRRSVSTDDVWRAQLVRCRKEYLFATLTLAYVSKRGAHSCRNICDMSARNSNRKIIILFLEIFLLNNAQLMEKVCDTALCYWRRYCWRTLQDMSTASMIKVMIFFRFWIWSVCMHMCSNVDFWPRRNDGIYNILYRWAIFKCITLNFTKIPTTLQWRRICCDR